MPTILELFKSSKENKQIPQEKAKTYVASKGQFLIDRENKLGNLIEKRFDPLQETALEQELSGLRPMRLVNSPTLYGTEIIRITTQKTSDVDAMKLSKNPNQQISLGKIGKFIEKGIGFVNKTLGTPQNVFPTYVINTKEFKEGRTPNKMIDLAEIRKDARGSQLGRFLKDTGAGTPNQLAKQSFGKGINLAKSAIRSALLGSRVIPVTSGSLDNFNQKYFEDENGGTYSDSMKDLTLGGSLQSFDISKVSPVFGLDRSADGGLFGTPRRFANREIVYGFQLSQNTSHQKRGEPSQKDLIDKFNTPDRNYSFGGKASELNDEAKKKKFQENEILRFIKPNYLLKNNWKKDRYSTDTTKRSYHNNTEKVYDNKLDNRRGLFSDRDILNQTGRLAESELKTIKYNGRTLDEVDLIPLKFQRVNDGASVFFRATMTGFNEQFSPSWENTKMLGSPFSFYNYSGIERKVSFNLKAYSMSQAELVMMWRRLEFLAHCTYPYQYNAGIVEPTLLYFTYGNIYNKKACFVDSLSYSIEDAENLWELGGGLLKTKAGTYNTEFGKKFYGGALNGEENSKENGKGAKVSELGLDVQSDASGVYSARATRIEGNEIYDKNLKRSNIVNTEIQRNQVSNGNYNMDNYKLPKIISITTTLTFIETKATTDFNLYGYGKKVM